ncbi:MAG: PD-(D/E)XK nuclease family transposase [Rickettsiaceae bacterium]|nr:PD-(D/E)XK nuclease family transposase [Rickettsiaceae bacterium]
MPLDSSSNIFDQNSDKNKTSNRSPLPKTFNLYASNIPTNHTNKVQISLNIGTKRDASEVYQEKSALQKRQKTTHDNTILNISGLPTPTPIITPTSTITSTSTITNKIIVSSPNGDRIKITIESPTKNPLESLKKPQYHISKIINNNKITLNYFDPTYDTAFKHLLSCPDLAKHFIAHTLTLNENSIISVKPLNVHLSEPGSVNNMSGTFATLAVDSLFKVKIHPDKKILVFAEMQRQNFPGFLVRTQMYAALIASSLIKKGVADHYEKIPTIKGIIVAFNNILNNNIPYCATISTNIKTQDGLVINDEVPSLIDIRTFELKKFEKHPDSLIVNQNSNPMHQWLQFFLQCGKKTHIPDNINDIIKLAYKRMSRENMPQDVIELLYTSQIKAQQLEHARQQEMRANINSAKCAGIEEGKIRSAVETILNLLKLPNLDLQQIKQVVTTIDPNKVESITKYAVHYKNQYNKLPGHDDVIKNLVLFGNVAQNISADIANNDYYITDNPFIDRVDNETIIIGATDETID